jgi:hypothetical protein
LASTTSLKGLGCRRSCISVETKRQRAATYGDDQRHPHGGTRRCASASSDTGTSTGFIPPTFDTLMIAQLAGDVGGLHADRASCGLAPNAAIGALHRRVKEVALEAVGCHTDSRIGNGRDTPEML